MMEPRDIPFEMGRQKGLREARRLASLESVPCPFGGECKKDGHPCDRDQHGERIEMCERNLERGRERYVQLSDVLDYMKRHGPGTAGAVISDDIEKRFG